MQINLTIVENKRKKKKKKKPNPSSLCVMESGKAEVDYEFLPSFRVYKDGHVERLKGTEIVPASVDSVTGVSSKDIVIIPETGISARLYLPKLKYPKQKVPLFVHFHGGAFCVFSPFHPLYLRYLNSLVSQANVMAISISYRRAPEHRLPTAYNDSWSALKWIDSHYEGKGSESWLTDHVDFRRVFLAGESSGGNIAHNMAMRAGDPESGLGMGFLGVVLIHPYFWGTESIGSEAIDPQKKAIKDRMWPFLCPSNPDNDDPRVNPVAIGAPSLRRLGCSRILVCIAEKDVYRDRERFYCECLRKSGWSGEVEIIETEGEDHAFHLLNQDCDKARELMKRLALFLNN